MFASQWDGFATELAALGYAPREARRVGPFVIAPVDLARGTLPA